MMLNLAHSDTTIMPDTTLDTVFPVSEPMTMQDTEAEPVNGIDLTDTFAEDLQPTDREELIKCFRKHSTCFASDDSDTGLCVRVEHDILTGDAAPTTTLPDAPAQGPCVSTSTLPFSPTGSSQSSDGSVDEDTSSSDTESLRQGPRQNLDRLRRPPQRSLLTLPILLLTVLSSGAVHLWNQLVTDGAIFRAHGNRVLSTSEWVIVTDVDLHYALTLLGDTETWLRAAVTSNHGKSDRRQSNDNGVSRFQLLLEDQIRTTAARYLKRLELVRREITSLHLTLDQPLLRKKRAILDGGGRC